MSNFRNILRDILYVSKISKTQNKKLLIFASVILTQVAAYTDIGIIVIFSAIIVDQYTGIKLLNDLIELFVNNIYLLPLLVIFRFVFQYLQKMILKNIEINVNKNLKIHILGELLEQKNYSTADSYFYLNILTTHISFFYSSFANFLNSFLQIVVYLAYLIISDSRSVLVLLVGVLILYYPAKQLLLKARSAMHEVYEAGQTSNKEIQRVVDNLFLIKILKKEKQEISNFSFTLQKFFENDLKNFRYNILNSFLPGFFTLFSLAIVASFSRFVKFLTIDFIGVALRLFQSVSTLSTALNQIINSHVHIEKFYEMENNKNIMFSSNFKVFENSEKIKLENVTFTYFNSEESIFENINLEIIKNSHTLIMGPNGSGKSTLLGLISGIYFPSKGKVEVFSEKFGFIGPNPLIFDGSLISNIEYGNDIKLDEDLVIKYLKDLDTFKEEKSYDLKREITNKTLSSGQMQKIAFIRALLSNIEILLLDESTANLDDASSKKIFELLNKKNVTIINSTHDQSKFPNADGILKINVKNEKRKISFKNLK
ncbi:ABC transporter ATP-binding protein/permease [Acidimicrobiaceae bacterium]|nr:ABC transporter ATP-binding protein/permease [Acidimicrobiaceae bacterium]